MSLSTSPFRSIYDFELQLKDLYYLYQSQLTTLPPSVNKTTGRTHEAAGGRQCISCLMFSFFPKHFFFFFLLFDLDFLPGFDDCEMICVKFGNTKISIGLQSRSRQLIGKTDHTKSL